MLIGALDYGVLIALDEVFPNSDKRFCCRHIYTNFKQQFPRDVLKKLFWAVVRSGLGAQFNTYTEEIIKISPAAHKWLSEIPFGNWSMCHFNA